MKARVRDVQAGLAENEIAIKSDVQIEGAGTVGDDGRTIAAEIALDGEEHAEQFERGEQGIESYDSIEESGLLCETDGGG